MQVGGATPLTLASSQDAVQRAWKLLGGTGPPIALWLPCAAATYVHQAQSLSETSPASLNEKASLRQQARYMHYYFMTQPAARR